MQRAEQRIVWRDGSHEKAERLNPGFSPRNPKGARCAGCKQLNDGPSIHRFKLVANMVSDSNRGEATSRETPNAHNHRAATGGGAGC